ncbi:hypothetical protein PAXRUDRAFT_828385 [Paxillus rubicundulus Ve08.2h10]|uniref:Unplaced genomic scaffold scaffold_311, whole genome shotgun sequence n=1 Tax=Paxillus rubicundulus Ve08.2h10 TaxID=930991 RepID=A0A0D0E7J0_9AGAM|nr:hypothetical protein PAXRUDRAFT_828385 [Paxillus rubicundulus Ve08.2h10]
MQPLLDYCHQASIRFYGQDARLLVADFAKLPRTEAPSPDIMTSASAQALLDTELC